MSMFSCGRRRRQRVRRVLSSQSVLGRKSPNRGLLHHVRSFLYHNLFFRILILCSSVLDYSYGSNYTTSTKADKSIELKRLDIQRGSMVDENMKAMTSGDNDAESSKRWKLLLKFREWEGKLDVQSLTARIQLQRITNKILTLQTCEHSASNPASTESRLDCPLFLKTILYQDNKSLFCAHQFGQHQPLISPTHSLLNQSTLPATSGCRVPRKRIDCNRTSQDHAETKPSMVQSCTGTEPSPVPPISPRLAPISKSNDHHDTGPIE